MGLKYNFHGKKGEADLFFFVFFFGGLKGAKNFRDNFFASGPPLQVFVNGP